MAKAQDYPYPGDNSPIYNGNTVDCGLLQNPDQKTTPIWFKVNGQKVGTQPHNKLHNPAIPGETGSYVPPGAYVDVNFNVNKNVANRYTLVTYTVAPDGTRTIFDYQSNIYNASPPAPPVQGNSNQQLVLTPTNCNYEVYWVKGCLVSTFTAALPTGTTQELTTGPVGNPYAYDAGGNLLSNNLILGYTFGDAAPNTVCEKCPTVVNGTNDQVSVQLIEIIDQPNGDKELIFSVINLNGTTAAPLTAFPYIGDVFFSGITPTHTKNNTPYQFRSDYQLSPVLPGYTVPAGSGTAGFGPKDAFVFDQRNNHNILAYDTCQSEIFRFKVDSTEYARLSSTTVPASPIPQVCVELSSKHPEPHQTLPPIYCFDIDFSCEEECPVVIEECAASDCNFSILYTGANAIVDPVTGSAAFYIPGFDITNISGAPITAITFTTTGTTATDAGYDDFNVITHTFDITAAPNLLTYDNPTPPWAEPGSLITFFYTLTASSVATVNNGVITLQPGNNVTVTIESPAGNLVFPLELATDDPEEVSECRILPFGPLPVELLSFQGKPSGEGIALNWQTASEKNNDRFEVERSLDGRNFEKIGTVKGNGTSSTLSSYDFTDKHPANGINYYRLNQVDFDGTNAHSQIIRVNTKERGGLTVQLTPNPCRGENCTVNLNGFSGNNQITIELTDLTGRVVFSQQLEANQTKLILPNIDTGNGVYILSAKDGRHSAFQKVIIQ